ncbi:Arm DNA-binding domain-containing protein [Vibrio mediterranei]|uniref:Arm DNA-binding domain-containing protein n=1 Tax=Vibrio mediterranei TaxID=689 RepID=UPI004067DC4B
MAHIRIRPNGRIQFDLHMFGVRFREGTQLLATPKNLRAAQAQLKQMNAEIDLGTFQYRDYFPESKKVAKFETLHRERFPDHHYPFLSNYANEWFERSKANWKPSYQNTVRNTLDRYLIAEFGDMLISDIRLSHVDYFRQDLRGRCGRDGKTPLTNKRINHILWPLIAILSLGAEEYQFNYPFRRYKALKEERAESSPMNIDEVHAFLAAVDPDWRDYFLVRFWTGLRSCEIHGLYWKHIDFDHRLIRVRQNYVNGEMGDVKTPKSRRELRMSEAVYQAMLRQRSKVNHEDEAFVFPHPKGSGLDTHYVSEKLWYPTLDKAGLKRRRPYETRHTAAVLHIAAHENPLYISHMLGHSNTKLLFDVYAPYVANASRQDGRAFDALMGGSPL